MKKISILLISIVSITTSAQQNIDNLLASGVRDAQRFTNDYMRPATDGLMYSMNQGWFSHGKSKDILGFEISIIGSAAFVSDDNRSFLLDSGTYENLKFKDGDISKEVATAFGDIKNVIVVVEGESSIPVIPPQDAEFELPNGLRSSNVNLVPSAFVQASIGFIKGTEFKVRVLPKIKTNDASLSFYGFGLQHEITSWMKAEKAFPIAISGLIAYTHLDSSYEFTDTQIVEGENQRFENNTNTTLLQLIGSTKLPVFNFYGGLGYLSGKSTTDLKGTYRVQSGIISSETIIDPFSVESKVSGVRATLGARVKLGFFRFNVDYSQAKYSGFSFGLSFGFR